MKPGPVAVVTLTLNGLSGTAAKPLAMINGRTFSKGEEGEIVTPNGRQKVRVVSINFNSESVIVEVNGAQRELRRRGL